jgi:hypothetical protein
MISTMVGAKRVVALVATVMAALLVLSVVAAPDAQAKKKRHHKRTLVQCPNQPGGFNNCVGTDAAELLVGRDFQFDRIEGKGGNDLYDGKGGDDIWEDNSLTSADTYRVSVKEFSGASGLGVRDSGGSKDTLDLSRVYSSFEIDFSLADRNGSGIADDLVLDAPGANNAVVLEFKTSNSIDLFRFKDRTLTADQVRGLLV